MARVRAAGVLLLLGLVDVPPPAGGDGGPAAGARRLHEAVLPDDGGVVARGLLRRARTRRVREVDVVQAETLADGKH